MSGPPVRTVAFDVGETLIDETRIFSRWADRLGIPRLTFLGVLGGHAATRHPHRGVFETFRPGFDLDAELAAWAEEEPDGLRENFDADDLYPDVRPCFEELRRRGVGVIIAGNQPPQSRDALVAMDLGADAILISDELGIAKPDPAFFAAVADAAGLPPGAIAYVGDRVDNDVQPSKAAGMLAVLLRRGPWGYQHADWPEAAAADVTTDSLLDLPALLHELGR